jgi:predicted DNA-binding transcriptional regulator AlpA
MSNNLGSEGATDRDGYPNRLVDLRELQILLGHPSRASIWRWCRAGRLPQPIRLGAGRLMRWRHSEIMRLLEGRQ